MSMGSTDSLSIDHLVAEWQDLWLDALKGQIYEMQHRRQLHDEFMDLLGSQDHSDTDIFGDCFHRMYIEAQVMAIRRQVDNDSRTLSLRRLFGQLEQHRRALTRSWYVDRWLNGRDLGSDDERERLEAEFHLERANEAFDQFTDGPGAELLGGRRLQEDRERLLELTSQVVEYANTTVGHTQRASTDAVVTYDDFHQALDHLGEMLQRYYLLINQGGLMSTTPIIQGDWQGPFRKPLL